MTSSLRTLILGITSVAVVVATLSSLGFSVRELITKAKARSDVRTERLTSAGAPLLLNALVVGDLASAEQVLRNLNAHQAWQRVVLYEADGTTVILDTSPSDAEQSGAPDWLRPLLALDLQESRIPIVAEPVVYGLLAVTPSSAALETEVWQATREAGLTAAVLLVVLIGGLDIGLRYGLRPVRALGVSAARVGAGDLSVRMPETRLAEIAPTVSAFNAMADNLERLLADLRAKESANRRLAAIVEQSEEAIVTIDLERRVTSWNVGAARLLRRAAPAMLHHPLAEAFGGDAEAARQVDLLIETRPPNRAEFELRLPDASVFVAAASSPLHEDDGHHAGWIIVTRDITRRKRAEIEVLRARDEAEAAARAKADFLATMSHEIRTPMNGVIGMTDLLLGTELTDEQRECAELVRTSASALLHVINGILDFSKIEVGQVKLESVEFTLRALVTEAVKPLAVRAYQEGVELLVFVEPDVPDWVVGDPGRLRQILVNLVGNAVKFTGRGEIVLRVSMLRADEREIELRFVLTDTGVGIPADKLHAIFEPFTQADGSTTRRYGGTGLGLAITRRLVEVMGGEIAVESREGHGATFRFTVRLGRAATAPGEPPAVDVDRVRGRRALLVDDNATSRRLLAEMLTLGGVTPTVVVDSAESAWRALESGAAANDVPDLVVTDHQMPGGDGLMLAQQIKSHPRLSALPIVVVSSSTRLGDVARARELGVAAFLTKPVGQPELLQAIADAWGRAGDRTRARPERTARPPLTDGGLRVLVAEDNPVNQRLALRLLERLGHAPVVADTGRAALVALETATFDLVLMDVQMPEMDGLEATAAVRTAEAEVAAGTRAPGPGSTFARRRRIPIIALTAHAVSGWEQKCRAAGMDGYLAKPITTDLLRATIARHVAASAGDGPATPIDAARALRQAAGDEALVKELAHLFVGDCPKHLYELGQALDAGDAARLQRAAHTLKGAVGALGGTEVQELVARLEALGRDGALEAARPLLPALRDALARIVEAFARQRWIDPVPPGFRTP